MSAGSVTAAMTRTGQAQRGQYLKSISKTRRRRCIQVMGAVARSAVALRRGRQAGAAPGAAGQRASTGLKRAEVTGAVAHWRRALSLLSLPV